MVEMDEVTLKHEIESRVPTNCRPAPPFGIEEIPGQPAGKPNWRIYVEGQAKPDFRRALIGVQHDLGIKVRFDPAR